MNPYAFSESALSDEWISVRIDAYEWMRHRRPIHILAAQYGMDVTTVSVSNDLSGYTIRGRKLQTSIQNTVCVCLTESEDIRRDYTSLQALCELLHINTNTVTTSYDKDTHTLTLTGTLMIPSSSFVGPDRHFYRQSRYSDGMNTSKRRNTGRKIVFDRGINEN